MHTICTVLSALLAGLLIGKAVYAETASAPSSQVEPEYKNWPVLGVSHRTDKNTLRVIVGNDIAVQAARSGKTQPWPDGAVLGKVVWEQRPHPVWPAAIVPGALSKAEFMVKDSKQYAETGGWGFGRWEGGKRVMNSKEQAAECFACHTAVKDADYVFTIPVYR